MEIFTLALAVAAFVFVMSRVKIGPEQIAAQQKDMLLALESNKHVRQIAETVPEEVRQVALRGDSFNAVKLLAKIRTDLNFGEVKDATNLIYLRSKFGEMQPSEVDAEISAQITEHLRAKRKIEAIKLYRAWKQVGLKDAKDAIDVWHKS